VQKRLLESWRLPPDSMANREVVLLIELKATGVPRRTAILRSNDRRLARSVWIAVEDSTPFPRVPPEASCLVGRPIRTVFRNPAD
jgi:hypothetical protein